MRRLLSLALAAMIAFAAVPAFAEPLPATVGSPMVGTGDEARSVDDLLQAGDYASGRVLARVTPEFGSAAPLSNDAASWSVEPLFTYAPVASKDASALRSTNHSASDQVILIQSGTMTTEELLLQLAGAPGVEAAEPDCVRTIGDPEMEPSVEPESPADATRAANSVGAATNDPLLDEQWQLASTAEAAGGTNVQELWQELGVPQESSGLKSVVVAVVDTGVDYTNPDLQGVMWSNPGNLGLPGVLAGLVGTDATGGDTYVIDPATGSWQAVKERLSAGKTIYGGSAVLDDALYVLGEDVLSGFTVFKRLLLETAPMPVPPTSPVSPTPSESPEAGAGAVPKPLARTGDTVPFASVAIAGMAVLALGALAFARRERR